MNNWFGHWRTGQCPSYGLFDHYPCLTCPANAIVSLWQIPDQPTAALMVEFYRQRQNYPDSAQALRHAKLEAIQRGQPLSAWAAFTLVGN